MIKVFWLDTSTEMARRLLFAGKSTAPSPSSSWPSPSSWPSWPGVCPASPATSPASEAADARSHRHRKRSWWGLRQGRAPPLPGIELHPLFWGTPPGQSLLICDRHSGETMLKGWVCQKTFFFYVNFAIGWLQRVVLLILTQKKNFFVLNLSSAECSSVCVSMNVCVLACVCVCTCVCACMHACVRMCMHACACMYACVPANTLSFTCVHAHK